MQVLLQRKLEWDKQLKIVSKFGGKLGMINSQSYKGQHAETRHTEEKGRERCIWICFQILRKKSWQ